VKLLAHRAGPARKKAVCSLLGPLSPPPKGGLRVASPVAVSKRKQPPDRTLNDAGRPVNENQSRGTRLQIQGKDDNGGMEIETNLRQYPKFLKENGA
jgi:hypothetical protein